MHVKWNWKYRRNLIVASSSKLPEHSGFNKFLKLCLNLASKWLEPNPRSVTSLISICKIRYIEDFDL